VIESGSLDLTVTRVGAELTHQYHSSNGNRSDSLGVVVVERSCAFKRALRNREARCVRSGFWRWCWPFITPAMTSSLGSNSRHGKTISTRIFPDRPGGTTRGVFRRSTCQREYGCLDAIEFDRRVGFASRMT